MSDKIAHLSLEQLADYLEGRLASAEQEQVESHLASGCQQCQADLAWLQETQALLANEEWIAPPSQLRTAVQQAFRQKFQSDSLPWWRVWPQRLPDWLVLSRSRALVAVTAVLIILFLSILVWQLRWRPQLQPVILAEANGLVAGQFTGGESWQLLSGGDQIPVRSEIRTSRAATAVLSFSDGSTTALAEDTWVTLLESKVSNNGRVRTINLLQFSGETHNRIQPALSAQSIFKIETPTAVITVVGTEFIVRILASGETWVQVIDGEVSVTGKAQTTNPTGVPFPFTQPTPTEAPKPSATSTPTASLTATSLPTATSTPSVTPSNTPRLTATLRPTHTATASPTVTPTPTRWPATTPSPTAVPTETATAVPPPNNPQPTRTYTPEPTATADTTPTLEPTEEPAEPTVTPEPTEEPPEPTATEGPPEPTETPTPDI